MKITTNGHEFQDIFSALQPSAIVMDIVMPDMDGIEWMSQKKFTSPVIIMSGYDGYIGMTEILGEKRGLSIAGILSKLFL